MNQNPVNRQQLPHQLNVGQVPVQGLVLAAVAVIAIFVGAFSTGAGFALVVLGLLATVIIDYVLWQQHESSGGGGAPTASGGGHHSPASAGTAD